jgi:hypothetical protein
MMTNDADSPRQAKCGGNGAWGGIYGLAFIGSLVYYIQHADTFLGGVVGVFKAIFWPAFVIYEVLQFIHG